MALIQSNAELAEQELRLLKNNPLEWAKRMSNSTIRHGTWAPPLTDAKSMAGRCWRIESFGSDEWRQEEMRLFRDDQDLKISGGYTQDFPAVYGALMSASLLASRFLLPTPAGCCDIEIDSVDGRPGWIHIGVIGRADAWIGQKMEITLNVFGEEQYNMAEGATKRSNPYAVTLFEPNGQETTASGSLIGLFPAICFTQASEPGVWYDQVAKVRDFSSGSWTWQSGGSLGGAIPWGLLQKSTSSSSSAGAISAAQWSEHLSEQYAMHNQRERAGADGLHLVSKECCF